MNKAGTVAVLAATVVVIATGARGDVPAGKQPGHFQPPPPVQVQCQVNDASCYRVAAYILEHITPWITNRVLVGAVGAQNVANGKLTNLEIDKLDIGWIERTDKSLIESKMNNDLSAFLKTKKSAGPDIIVEIFAFDQMGLNVGQTDMTQDYYQGDEAKYWKTFMVGPGAVFVDQVGMDDGRHVSQANLTITNPETGKAIGAMTVGIDIDKLAKSSLPNKGWTLVGSGAGRWCPSGAQAPAYRDTGRSYLADIRPRCSAPQPL